MPQVKEYTSQVSQLRPDERGTDARLQEARRTGAFYNQAGEALSGAARAQADAAGDIAKSASGVADAFATLGKQQEDYAGHREIAKGAAAGAQLFSNLNDQWDATVKAAGKNDPNDPTVAAKFREEVLEPQLQKFKAAYSGTDLGSQWAEQHVEQMRNHLFQKTAADMSSLAAQGVKVNVDQLSNATSNTAFKSPDTHTVDYLLSQVEGSVNAIIDSAPNLKGAAAEKARSELTQAMKEKIVKAGAAGAIAKASDPEVAAKTFSDRYPDYMNGPEAATFAKAAKTQAKSNLLADKQIEAQQRQLADQNAHKAANKNMADNVSIDPVTNRMVINPAFANAALDIVRNNPNAPSAANIAHTQLTWLEHQQNAKQVTVDDPAVKADLYSRMFDPTNPTTEVDLMKANIEGKIAPHTFTAMHQLQKALEETPLKGEVMKDTLAAVKANLTYTMPGLPGKDPKGLQNYSAFVQQFVPQYLAASRAGTLKPNSLDTRDPTSMISQAMAPFKRTAKQLIDDRVQEMSTFGDGNITGPNKTITGIETIDQPAGAKPFVPPNNWQFSPSTKQYRDPAGVLYDVSGKKIEKTAAPSAPRQ